MGTDASGSGSTSNAAQIGGPFAITDNSGADLITILGQDNSPGAKAGQTPGGINWNLLAGLAFAATAGLVFLARRK